MAAQQLWFLSLLAAGSMIATAMGADEAPTVAKTMTVTPTQKDVEYETPKPAEFAKCKLEVERKGKLNGWVVVGPAGQILRKFLDTDGDNKLDQFRFYNHGIEVYRDIDSNHNGKVDQYRWLNRGGSRWGIDQNEDGRIDQWKVLSAAEASKEAIRAMIVGDASALMTVMITADDLKSLGINPQLGSRLLESASDPGKKAKAVMEKSKVMTSQSRWSRFDAQMPSTIPVEDEKANADLQIYESANAIIETPRKDPSPRFDAVQIGEMIRVGEVWKLTQVPVPIEGEGLTSSPILMEPLMTSPGGSQNAPGPSPKVAQILKDLQDVEQRLLQPKQTAAQVKTLMSRRAVLLKEAIELAETDEERVFLTKQTVDGYALAAQMGTYPEGVKELRAIEADIAKKMPTSSLLPYTTYRLMQAEYAVNSQEADEKDEKKEKKENQDDKKEKLAEIQKTWLKSLEEFVTTYPSSDDADDAMFVLGNHEEFQGRTKEAIVWYQRLVAEKPKSEVAIRAQGALRRLELNGQVISLEGPLLSGGNFDIRKLKERVVLVVFWNGNYELCVEDVPQLRALYELHKSKGFEIVGVALESDKAAAQSFVDKHKITWPQIFQPSGPNQAGGLNSPIATSFGIISFPTMFLVNKEGKVVSRNATITDVKADLPDLLKASNVVQSSQNKNNAQSKK